MIAGFELPDSGRVELGGINFSLWTIVIGHATFCIMIVYNNVIARLRRTQTSLVEASMGIGADGLQTFRHVTLPLISPTVFFNMILGVIFALRAFEVAFVATMGGPAKATWFVSLHIYQNAFVSFDMGYASSLAWMFLMIIFALTYLQFRLSGGWVFYAGERR